MGHVHGDVAPEGRERMTLSGRAAWIVAITVFALWFALGLVLPNRTGDLITYAGIVMLLYVAGILGAIRLTKFRAWAPGPAALVAFFLIFATFIVYVLLTDPGRINFGETTYLTLRSALFTASFMALLLFPYVLPTEPPSAAIPPPDVTHPLNQEGDR